MEKVPFLGVKLSFLGASTKKWTPNSVQKWRIQIFGKHSKFVLYCQYPETCQKCSKLENVDKNENIDENKLGCALPKNELLLSDIDLSGAPP